MRLSQENKTALTADFKQGVYTTKELVAKYNFKNAQVFYQAISLLRKDGLLPKRGMSKAISKAWVTRRANSSNTEKVAKTEEITNKPVTDYRTVYFKDFSVQIHKRALARLVIDHRNDLHILNA